ncbi:hypothetical protein VTN77DRAFT_6428 [Rasamsonia byssochlamydoides]|uniref:uncharacterized protein n=1 Tax=Rasamsonia byssochlamydoides TaxID=89139 RepID=UPI0037425B94
MSPASNTSSPVKRPALGRRSASSHALVSMRTSPSNAADTSEAHPHPQKAPVHKVHRAHVVGGAHRVHGRNPSFGKNLNKLHRVTSGHNVLAEGATIVTGARHHQRKKSAPVTPAASPRGSHGRGGSTVSLGEHKAHTSMRKNYSTPALPRNTSTVLGKKALVTDRPQTAKPRVQKTVGFELADSDSDEEWEDSTQSPESTRRGSVAPSKDDAETSAENNTVLVDPLTFVKRPYPQVPQSRSLPESSINAPPQEPPPPDDEHPDDEEAHSSHAEDDQQPMRTSEHEDIATRLLSQSRPSKAPPAMSSISAIATPAPVDTSRRNASLTNLASSHDASRNAPSTSGSAMPNTTGVTAQATSSSIEGGVSRFIINDKTTPRTDSDPNTPSSFLPHYHPQSPPSPGRSNTSKKAKATSPPPRPPGDGPPSRTQQKLWLQRTATLTTSPPDPHGSPALPTSSIDPAFMAAPHSRAGGRPYDGGRGGVNGSVRPGVSTHDSETKHIRKAYEKTASELNVVRRFHNPTKNSFDRVDRILNEAGRQTGGGTEQNTSLAGKSVKSAPSLTNGQSLQSTSDRRQGVMSAGKDDSPGRSQLISKNRQSGSKHGSRVYFQDQDDVVNINDPSEPGDRLDVDDQQRSGQNILSDSAAAAAEQGTGKDTGSGDPATEVALLLRRMWESREVASPG